MDKQAIICKDLGFIDYKVAWDYQESLLAENVLIKSAARDEGIDPLSALTKNYLLFCEHPPVYTLGKTGSMKNVLLSERAMKEKEIQFYKVNRGGDITFHGPGQIVGYLIFDLEKFVTDIGKFLRALEQVIIDTIAVFGIRGERSPGQTGVWVNNGSPAKESKICAMGIRCSRWITMHGFALNVNTDLAYFQHIIPCGINNKQVTSMEKELIDKVPIEGVKELLLENINTIFGSRVISDFSPVQ